MLRHPELVNGRPGRHLAAVANTGANLRGQREAPRSGESGGASWFAAAGLVLAGIAVYANSFETPYVFDDLTAISLNRTIHHLWPIGPVLRTPPDGLTVSGRPLLNLSFALNYAFGGLGVKGYHALNLGIHLLGGLALFGIMRRTLQNAARARRSSPEGEGGPDVARRTAAAESTFPAFAIALLWTVHPLQTESVTYLSQRAESLMGLFYLLTMYCFIRGTEADGDTKRWRVPLPGRSGTRQRFVSNGWAILSVLACLCGMATKEVMVSAPVIVLLYDRTFVAGSFREAWRRRWGLYLGLAATWSLVGYEFVAAADRGGTAGFGIGVSWWTYVLTQFPAVLHYLRLSIWPHPLIFDYGTEWVTNPWLAVGPAIGVVGVAAASAYGLSRGSVRLRQAAPDKSGLAHGFGGRALGFAGAWFFAVLAPTSLVPGIRQTLAEHRMYLALAPLLAVAVVGLWGALGRKSWPIMLALAVGFGSLAARRNEDYQNGRRLWRDTLAKRPLNPYAHYNVGEDLLRSGEAAGAIVQFKEALRLKPDYAEGENNLGTALVRAGKVAEAIGPFREAIRLEPRLAAAYVNLGGALMALGRADEAAAQFRAALEKDPDFVEAHNGLGDALMRKGRLAEARVQFGEALELKPDYAEAHNNLGNALVHEGRMNEAIAEFEAALRLKPDFPAAHNGLGTTLFRVGRQSEAQRQITEAIRLDPSNSVGHFNLANILAATGHLSEAISHYETALRLDPNDALVHNNFGSALAMAGRIPEAKTQYREALRLRPDLTRARDMLEKLGEPAPAASVSTPGEPLPTIGR